MISAEQQSEQGLYDPEAWHIDWSRPDTMTPVQYGVQSRVPGGKWEDGKIVGGTKYYQAFCNIPGPELYQRSEEYEALDGADADLTGDEMRFPSRRDKEVYRAAEARASMRADQAAPSDMEKLAVQMWRDSGLIYRTWYQDEEKRKKQALQDEQDLRFFKNWLRGLTLLMASDDEESKQLVKALFSGQVEKRSHHKKRVEDGSEEANA